MCVCVYMCIYIIFTQLLEATAQSACLLSGHDVSYPFCLGWKDNGGWARDCLAIRFATRATAAGASMIYQLTGNEKNSLQLKI